MKELNLGLSRKYDIGKEIEMHMKTQSLTLKEFNHLRQEDTRENRRLVKNKDL